MKRYNFLNNVFGWVAFCVAAITYLLTIEPTASFWDCGEFISASYKMEVGHAPGAPFFMLMGKFFSLFASSPAQVGMMVNVMSALMSAATILFLFWTITHLAKKLIYQDHSQEITLGQTIAIIGSGLVGSLSYAYTDTFWFSAVEAEVYAFSSMFTALVFWLILKWENRADCPDSDKWLILIAYMMGLSIGVHLLNLLCIPAMVLVYYFKKAKEVNFKGTLIALAWSFALIIALMYGIIPGVTKVGGWVELAFVNTLGFSYNTGTFFYIALLIGTIVWGLWLTMRATTNMLLSKIALVLAMVLAGVPLISSSYIINILIITALTTFIFVRKELQIRTINTALLSLLVVLVGYSSYALIPIRSSANPPMDQNSPENIFALRDYLGREQYGETPLFHGQTYASEVERDGDRNPITTSSTPKYDKVVKENESEKDQYVVTGTSDQYKYTNTMLFPRMHSKEPRHIQGYKNWGGIGDDLSQPPTMMQNLRFFIEYQLNFMYWRYFMWNFAGRQNDKQNTGGITNGNWITGIPVFDQYVLGLGPQDNLPPDVTDNKAHNRYFLLPLLLGIVGILYQLFRKEAGEQGFWITFMLFFMTGIAIVMYLNQKPYEPRERDYAYAGSFYAFTIWIGLGVAGIWELLRKKVPSTVAATVATVVCLGVPVLLAAQNWDDHDRSDRYVTRDFGMNYLLSCEPNAIIFTNGDNDTFPLWYAQDVEGFRTDVRVCNLSYLQTDWYVDQMRRQAYESEALPIEWERKRYVGDKGIYAQVVTSKMIQEMAAPQLGVSAIGYDWNTLYDTQAYKDVANLDEVMHNLRNNDTYAPRNPFRISEGLIVPSDKLLLRIDASKVNWKNLNVSPTDSMVINLSGKHVLYRQELMILEMLSNINKNNWKRPIYFALTVGQDMYMNLENNFRMEGLAYRITPNSNAKGGVNTEVMYDNMMNKFKWGGVDNPNVYLDENILRSCQTYRHLFTQLAKALIAEGKKDKALKVLDRCMQVLPPTTVPYGGDCVGIAEAYNQIGQRSKAETILKAVEDRAMQNLVWYNRLTDTKIDASIQEIIVHLNTLNGVANAYRSIQPEKYKALKNKLIEFARIYYAKNAYRLGNWLMKDMTDEALVNYHTAQDSTQRNLAEFVATATMQVMQEFSPALLQEYQRPTSTEDTANASE